MIGNVELKLDLFLDQRKHKIKRNVSLTSDTSQLITQLDLSFDVRLCYSRIAFLENLILDIEELINNESLSDEYYKEKQDDKGINIQSFRGFLARKSLRDKQSLQLKNLLNLKFGDDQSEESSESNQSNDSDDTD
mmetsp:Transcript_7598/g.6727  ORF Transcript_7598/g.6727 Transcript_7598/m.6727 type:complete len:135 (+) Transcript_7598:478-882(+)